MTVSVSRISRPVAGERHLFNRQTDLRSRAAEIAASLAEDPAIVGVWLTGSVAKGQVDGASDLDLHVFTQGAAASLAAWRFAPGSAAENLHVFPAASIRQGVALLDRPTELGRWMAGAGLADALSGAQQLYQSPQAGPLSSDIETLVAARGRPAVQVRVADAFVGQARRFLGQARGALEDGATPDAQQHLRTAGQELLVAHLIRRGWILRGSKKRPEIARAYGVDADAPEFFRLFESVTGLNGLTPSRAVQICESRQCLRAAVARSLRRRLAAQGLCESAVASRVAPYEAHITGAVDYYRPLLDNGIYCGPVNHIRSFGGVPKLPALIMQTLGKPCAYPITEWSMSTDETDAPDRSLWIEVSALSVGRSDVEEMLAELGRVAERIKMRGLSGR